MDRSQKSAFVTDLHGRLKGAQTIVVAHYRGLTVKQLDTLRADMRKVGGEVQVVKNRLAKIAMADTPFAGIADMMQGPSVIAFAPDAVAPAKLTQAFADANDQMVIIGGSLGNKRLEKADVKALATMPSLDQLRGKLVGLLQAPAQKLASVTQAPASQIARVIALKPESIAA